jgi:hypothetical protein
MPEIPPLQPESELDPAGPATAADLLAEAEATFLGDVAAFVMRAPPEDRSRLVLGLADLLLARLDGNGPIEDAGLTSLG